MGKAREMEMIPARHWPAHPIQLTDRELDIARLLSNGNSRAEITHKMNLAESTVDKHLRRIKDRLGARSLTDLVLAARRYFEQATDVWADGQRAAFQFRTGAIRADMRPVGGTAWADWVGAGGAAMRRLTAARDFAELFIAMERCLAELGLPLIAWCHVMRRGGESIVLENHRSNFPAGGLPDLTHRAEVNPILRLAMADWSPVISQDHAMGGGIPLIVIPLPGATMQDRIVAILAPANPVGAEFGPWFLHHQTRVTEVLLAARHAHLALSLRALPPELQALIDALAGGEGMEAAARLAGLSRRTAERILTTSRLAMHCRSNTELICLVRQQTTLGRFDFGMAPP